MSDGEKKPSKLKGRPLTAAHRTAIRDGVSRMLQRRGSWQSRVPLREKQRAMRERQAKQSRVGRPANALYDCAVMERARKRILAFVLMKEHGYSVARVAAELGKTVESVQRWVDAGYPLG